MKEWKSRQLRAVHGAHGPDEHYSIEMFHKGIDTAIYYLEEVAK